MKQNLIFRTTDKFKFQISQSTEFRKLWLGALNCFEIFMKVEIRRKRSEKLQELVSELLKNTLLAMEACQ